MDNTDFDWFDMEENDYMEECEMRSYLEMQEYERVGEENE